MLIAAANPVVHELLSKYKRLLICSHKLYEHKVLFTVGRETVFENVNTVLGDE